MSNKSKCEFATICSEYRKKNLCHKDYEKCIHHKFFKSKTEIRSKEIFVFRCNRIDCIYISDSKFGRCIKNGKICKHLELLLCEVII